jgi:N-acetylmuramoyl-L-alanine amidase
MRWIRSQSTRLMRSRSLPVLLLAPILGAASQNPQQPQPQSAPQSAPPPVTLPQPGTMPAGTMPAGTPALPGQQPSPAQPRFLVVLDAAHGGDNTGARISDSLIEKDIVLALSVRLRSTLSAHGIGVITTRESDTSLTPADRAGIANHAQASACILLHATATGSGVHLFTSSLAPAPYTRFAPWQTAQSAYVTQSLRLSSDIDSALAHAQIPVTLGRASVQPIDNLACPAVAIEIAPLTSGNITKAEPISGPSYQKSIIDAITAALDQWRSDWRQQP